MVDPKKLYRTRDGRKTRIYAVDGPEDYPFHGAIETNFGWQIAAWDPDGFWTDPDHEDGRDLIELKPLKVTHDPS
jgi:hypothetical protein